MSQEKQLRIAVNAIHIIAWAYIFTSPILQEREMRHFDFLHYLPYFTTTLCSCLLFYFCYLYLVPRLIFGEKKHYRLLFLTIAAATLLLTAFLEVFHNFMMPYLREHTPISQTRHHCGPPADIILIGNFKIFLWGLLRNLATFLASAGIALSLQLALRWQRSENERQKAETARAEAELRSLRHQLSPHFLLNSLNNIYSLVAFDQGKAQATIVELSKMLRYQLYESTAQYVPLKKEVEFLNNYISLMRIRLSGSNTVKVDLDYDDEDLLVAPNILIYLVENAFKYGAHPSKEASIDIRLSVKDRHLTFFCRNSISQQKSACGNCEDREQGAGLGLQQVKRMLQIYYPKRHEWIYGADGKNEQYQSFLSIEL